MMVPGSSLVGDLQALGRLSLPLLREVLDGQLLRSRMTKMMAATPSILMLRKHHRHLLQDVFPMRQGHLIEAFVQLCHNAKPLPPLFWLSFAFTGLQTVQVSERLSLWSLHFALRHKRSSLFTVALLLALRRIQVPSSRFLQEKYLNKEKKEAFIAFWKQSWKVLKDLLSAAKSAVVHGVNRPDAPNGGPRRVAPGEVFSSPRSGASEERCVVSEIQQPPVFAGDK
eukprot:symbB.v1.2.001697.t2/scaffold93.1/size335462/12